MHLTADTSRRILRLQQLTLAWMLVECGAALFSAYHASSPALLAFGADSLVELLSATVVLLQFAPVFTMHSSHAARFTGMLLFALSAVILLVSTVSLVIGTRPDASWTGIAVTVGALAIMPFLARAKKVAARKTNNRALSADAVQSATCAYLAGVTLTGLVLNAIFQIRWIDPAAALLAIPIIWVEGRRAMRGETCGCCGLKPPGN